MFTWIFIIVLLISFVPLIFTIRKAKKIYNNNQETRDNYTYSRHREEKKMSELMPELKTSRWIISGLFPVLWIIGWIAFSIFSSYATEYWWYQEMGRTEVFWTLLVPKLKIFCITFGIVMILLSGFAIIQFKKTFSKKYSLLVGLLFGFTVSLIMAEAVSGEWVAILMYLNHAHMGIVDPIFQMDASYYMFSLPMYDDLLFVTKFLLVTTMIYCLALWLIKGIRDDGGSVSWNKDAEFPKAFLFLAALWCGIHAFDLQLAVYQLIYADHGLFSGLNYVAAHVKIPIYHSEQVVFGILGILMILFPFFKKAKELFLFISIATIIVMFSALIVPLFMGTFNVIWVVVVILFTIIIAGYLWIWGRKMHRELLVLINLAITIIIVQFIVNGGIIPLAVQSVYVNPNEKVLEAPYIKNNIEWTKKAFCLTDEYLKEKSIPYSDSLTKETLIAEKQTVSNIRILDYDATIKILDNSQTETQYYDFPNVDVDRYIKNDTATMYFVGAREMNQEGLQSQTYYNTRYVYGHGYGYIKAKGNAYDITSGYPEFEVKGMPIKNGEPRIYYQEKRSTDFFYVNSDQAEIDYPVEKGEIEYAYTGKGGILLTTSTRKLCFAKQYDWRLFFGGAPVNEKTKIMIKRTVEERVKALCPFISWDEDALFVIRPNGKTAWIVDGYSTTEYFPYASAYNENLWGGEDNEFNYIRHSVKAVVDPFDGTVEFYTINEKNDPIISTIKNIFPDMFKPLSEMPADLKEHLLYPIRYFKAQTYMHLKYHMNDPYEFYQQDKIWRVAYENYKGEKIMMEPRYMLVKLPGEKKERFVITIPFTPKELSDGQTRDFLTGWAAGGCDAADFLKLNVYLYPKGEEIFGPWMIENQTNTDGQISKTFTLLGQQGSTVWQGNLMLVPIGNTIISIEPMIVFAKTGNGEAQLPSIRMIIAYHNKRIAWGRTTDEALFNLINSIKPQEMESFTGTVQSVYNQYEAVVPVMDKNGKVTSKTISVSTKQEALDEINKAILQIEGGLKILKDASNKLSEK